MIGRVIGTLIFFGILLLIDLYAYSAVHKASEAMSPVLKWAFRLSYWSVTLIVIAGSLLFFNEMISVSLGRIVGIIFICFMIPKLVFIIFMLFEDVFRLGKWVGNTVGSKADYNLSRSRFLSQAAVIIGSIPIVVLGYGMIRNVYRYQFKRMTVALKNLPASFRGTKILQISDIHIGSLNDKEKLKDIVTQINAEQADYIFFTGDLVNSVADEMEGYIEIFRELKAKKSVHSVLGNHDYGDYARFESKEAKETNLERLKSIHAEMGWDLLLNENRISTNEDGSLAIIGVENISGKPHFKNYGDMKKAYSGAENADVKLLLSHDPSHWDTEVINDFKGVDVTFSGHTHGFQFGIDIPGFKWSPVQYAYKRWAGLYEKSGQYLYVNRGFGVLGYPGRVGILPEITVMELT